MPLVRHLIAASLLAGAVFSAAAGPLRASASLATDPGNVVNAESPTVQATALYPNAQNPSVSSIARRRHLVIDSNGGTAGDAYNMQYGGSADNSTVYQLWNLAQNRPLTDEEAWPLTLSFNFNLSGLTTTEGGYHLRSVGLGGLLTGGNWARGFGDNGLYIGGDPSDLAQGNQALLQSIVDVDYTLQHTNAATGTVGFSLQGVAALAATVYYDLWLESVTLVQEQTVQTALAGGSLFATAAAGVWNFADGLGVALFDGNAIGDVIIVVPAATGPNDVPAPGTLALLLAGLLVAARRSRGFTPARARAEPATVAAA